MKLFEANISPRVSDFLNKKLYGTTQVESANQELYDSFGIKRFFDSQEEFLKFKEVNVGAQNLSDEPNRDEYGDFQTNQNLANSVTNLLKSKRIDPKTIVEPTCGKGNFIIATLATFPNLENVIGVEIYKPYIWETKFNIIHFYLENPTDNKPEIEIIHFNSFDFDFRQIAMQFLNNEFLVIGNPPWVTNSKLSNLNSINLPQKTNFKKHNGLDAMTGKANFDIGETITTMMINAFQNSTGTIAFLVKNSVIKNILFDQKQHSYALSNIQKHTIDSKKEFNVSVEAALFFSQLNAPPEFTCTEFDFYNHSNKINRFGWVDGKFVSNIDLYTHSVDIDGVCSFEWRQGIKHDLSSIMELERLNGLFINGFQQKITLEEDLVFGLLKSSDLKQPVIDKTRKHTIIPQKKLGQDTAYIVEEFPKTYDYLYQNKHRFDARKSSIYKNKPNFSIFGIGDYSFAPFKIAISGLYKTFTFSLILPQKSKPVMLDDTCYFLGFDNIDFATYTLILLNSEKTRNLLQSITFNDAKRTFTKEILMRIDLFKIALQSSDLMIQQDLCHLNDNYSLGVNLNKWEDFLSVLKSKTATVLTK